MKQAILVYDERTNNGLLERARSIAEQSGYEACKVNAARLRSKSLQDVSLVLHCTEGRYEEGTEKELSEFVKAGGTLVVLGGNPFSRSSGEAALADMHKGIRAFGIGDTFQEVPHTGKCFFKVLRQNWNPYEKEQEEVIEVHPGKVYAGLYSLSYKTEGRDMERHADLLPLAGFFDEDGHMIAAPVVRVSYKKGGALYLFTWEEAVLPPESRPSEGILSENILSQPWARELLSEICSSVFAGAVSFDAEMTYARYYPGEEVCLELHDIALAGKGKVEYLIEVKRRGDSAAAYTCKTMIGAKRYRLALPVTEEGEYEVWVRAYLGGICQMIKRTGFYLISEEKILEDMSRFPRMKVDQELSVDFCLQEGKPVCIHGTTYFVTDTYQKCFLHFNPAQCREDLSLLQKDGFNVLRSGNWMLNVEFYGKDGGICEKSRRALQAYFYCALQYGFTVQFTLGIITLNDWDQSLCAIHNPRNMKKVMCLVSSFGELFGNYTNVMLDIINEPSYSYAGQWKNIRPSGDPYERKAWIKWLKEKYGTITKVRQAWGENAVRVPDFASVDVPKERCYAGTLYRTEEDREYAMAADFWLFAQQSYDRWLSRVRSCVREKAPDMVVMMGRDESLRVPEEQDMILSGNLDMVCWHQWNRDAIIYVEYLLNRVKGHITCAQEMGIYRVEQMRGGKTLTDERVAHKLERKLFFGFSNWVIWQSFHNPDKEELSENMLGTYRSDRSETPAMPLIREMIAAENKAIPYMTRRQEDAFPILTLYSTSSHYSIYGNQAVEALRSHIFLLNNCLRMQSDVMPEHLFDRKNEKAIGKPALIMLPGVMRIREHCFEELMEYAGAGGCVLISGNVDEDEHFVGAERVAGMVSMSMRITDPGMGVDEDRESLTGETPAVRKVMNFEKLRIGEKLFTLDFRRGCEYGDAENFLKAAVTGDTYRGGVYEVKVYPVGKGKVIYCPLPLELAENRDAILALYEMALAEAGITPKVYETESCKEAVLIHAIVYENCTSYTLVNDGPKETLWIKDLRSNTELEIQLSAGRGCKFWVGTDGELLGAYGASGRISKPKGAPIQ